MRSASTALQNFFQSIYDQARADFWYADLFTVSRLDGVTAYWSTWPLPLTVTLRNPDGSTIGPFTFTAFGPYVTRTSIEWGIGLDNKQMKIKLVADQTMKIGPTQRLIPVIQSLAQDLFAGAEVRVDRLYMATPGATFLSAPGDATIILWKGPVGDVEVKRASAEITVDSKLVVLNTQVPRAVYQGNCRHNFGDSSCTFDLSTVTSTGTVQGGSSRFVIATNLTPPAAPDPPASAPSLSQSHNNLINLAARTVYVTFTYTSGVAGETIAGPEASVNLPPSTLVVVAPPPTVANASGWNCYMSSTPGTEMLQNGAPIALGSSFTEPSGGFVQGTAPPIAGSGGFYAKGVITFTSGALAGLGRGIQASDASGNITLSSGLPVAPAAGDTFVIRRGCAKTLATCQAYDNTINFGGMPFIPQPEAVL